MLSAFFASLTAIFAKIGVKDVNTDLATAIRTVVILVLAWSIALFRGGAATNPLYFYLNRMLHHYGIKHAQRIAYYKEAACYQ